MTTLVNNIIFLGILLFAGVFVVIGLFRLTKVLKGELTVGEALATLGGVILLAAFVVWAGLDFLGNKMIITTIGNWIMQILTQPLG